MAELEHSNIPKPFIDMGYTCTVHTMITAAFNDCYRNVMPYTALANFIGLVSRCIPMQSHAQ